MGHGPKQNSKRYYDLHQPDAGRCNRRDIKHIYQQDSDDRQPTQNRRHDFFVRGDPKPRGQNQAQQHHRNQQTGANRGSICNRRQFGGFHLFRGQCAVFLAQVTASQINRGLLFNSTIPFFLPMQLDHCTHALLGHIGAQFRLCPKIRHRANRRILRSRDTNRVRQNCQADNDDRDDAKPCQRMAKATTMPVAGHCPDRRGQMGFDQCKSKGICRIQECQHDTRNDRRLKKCSNR